MAAQVVIRTAAPTDAQRIAHLTRACWAGKVPASSSAHQESPERVHQDLTKGGGFILLLDQEIVGSVRWLPLDDDPNIWEMLRMGVLPAHRGASLSQHLLAAVVQAAKSASVSQLRLGVRCDQPRLLDFYAAHGFALTPDLSYSHANPKEPAPYVMLRSL